MRKRVYIALAVLLVTLAGVIAWQVRRLREPVYQGEPLSFWLEGNELKGCAGRWARVWNSHGCRYSGPD